MPQKNQYTWLLLLALPAVLAGCVTRDERPAISASAPSQWNNAATARLGQPSQDLADWWLRYRDPRLDRLVAHTLQSNPQIEEALQRVLSARALARAEGVNRLPALNGAGSIDITSRLAGDPAGLNEAGEARGNAPLRTVARAQATFDSAWEIDLFRRLLNQSEAAKRAALANAADLQAVRALLVADTVRAYIELRAALRLRAVVKSDVEARRRLLGVVRDQQRAGAAGEFDVQRAEAAHEASRARLPTVELSIRTAQQRLATLSGVAMTEASAFSFTARAPRIALPGPTLPADVIRVRPDVQRSEQFILQRAALADVAYADLYPRLVLTGSLNIQTSVIGLPVAGIPVTFAGGPGVTLPLFDWGRRRATLDARDADFREAVASHRRTVLQAVEEVEIASAATREGARRLERLARAVDAARRAFSTSDRLYRAGLIGLTERLQTEGDLRQAEFDLANAEEFQAVSLVALYRALGAAPRWLAEPSPPMSPQRIAPDPATSTGVGP